MLPTPLLVLEGTPIPITIVLPQPEKGQLADLELLAPADPSTSCVDAMDSHQIKSKIGRAHSSQE